MRAHIASLGLVVVLFSTASCNKDAPSAAGSSSAAPPARPASGGDGSGDRSGSSIANARPLKKGTPAAFKVPCSGQMVLGPFTFTRDPEKLKIHAAVKSASGAQVCTGGEWIDASGKFIAVGGLPCAEGAATIETDLVLEYSPGNGGQSARTVYYASKFGEPQPTGCATVQVTLSLP